MDARDGLEGIVTIAAVNGLAFGGGCELAMACDIRIAARSALFGQPEIKLGIIPGFGGTQRLPRLVGTNKALEMNLVGDPILAEEAFELGLVNRMVEDHELLDTALTWARKLAGQAPLAVAQIKRVSAAGDLDEGIAAEKHGFATAFASARREGGHRRVPRQTRAASRAADDMARPWRRPSRRRPRRWSRRLAELIRGAGSVVALTGAGISVPSGIPDFRTAGTGLWENVDPMEVAHIDAFRARPRALLELLRRALRRRSRTSGPTAPTGAGPDGGDGAGCDGVITQNIDMLHRRAGSRELVEVHGTIAPASCPACGGPVELEEVRRRASAAADGVPRCAGCGAPLKPDVVLFGELLDPLALGRARELCEGAEVLLCIGSSLEVHPVAALPGLTLARGGALAILTPGPPRWMARPRCACTATSWTSSTGCSAPLSAPADSGGQRGQRHEILGPGAERPVHCLVGLAVEADQLRPQLLVAALRLERGFRHDDRPEQALV